MFKKLQLRPGVNRERTSYANEGGWYDVDKVRFSGGLPEKIGGWQRISASTYLGVCRSLWGWVTLGGQQLVGVGTNLKFYIERGGDYYDITPVRHTSNLTDPFDTTDGSVVVLVTDVAHGAQSGDYVTFSGASTVGGLDLDGEYEVTVVDGDTYTITAPSAATSTTTGGGSVTAEYQVHVGNAGDVPLTGWGAGGFGMGPFGIGTPTTAPMRLWSQSNFGEDLVFAYRGGPLLYWDASNGVNSRGMFASSLPGADDVPALVNYVLVSDINRFVLVFGCTDHGGGAFDPMLIRWSDQENAAVWTPSALNQAGSLRLSRGTQIVTALQGRQEVIIWTDSAVYSMQYLGAPDVWGVQILGDNVTIAGPNVAIYANNMAYWMGKDKFYQYDGTVIPLPCDVRRFVFDDFNMTQYYQAFAGTNQAHNEVWWFYCSANSSQIDRYVVFNYEENVWYYGSLGRTAWLDTQLRDWPLAATYHNNLVYHEYGVDNDETGTPQPIHSYIESAQFDLDDGDHMMFVRSILPDFNFSGSAAGNPTMTVTMMPMKNSGSGYNNPLSVGGESSADVTRASTVVIERYTGQVFVRVRGRQMVLRVENNELGTNWQMGEFRVNMRPDGRRMG